jgi:hypothetical protein
MSKYEQVETGIYKYTSKDGETSYHERPSINGNAFKYGLRKELVDSNPVENFPRFQPKSAVRHCREFQPRSAEELHEVTSLLSGCTSTISAALLAANQSFNSFMFHSSARRKIFRTDTWI